MATIYTKAIQEMYVAYFNRPADPAGLAYWEGVVAAANGSTAAVGAAFAASAEYKAEYEDLNATGTLRQIYRNLFNTEADDAGLAYWANLVSTGQLSIDKAVTAIAAGAQGVHKTTFANKVIVSTAFTTAIDTDAEKAAYSGDLANEAAKEFLATITTDASVTTALVPATLNATVASIVKASVPFTLTSALAAFDAANDARDAFLVTADGDGKATTSATPASIKAMVDAAKTAIGSTDLLVDGDAAVVGYGPLTSDGVNAALLADAIEARADAVVEAKTDLAAAVKAVGAVTGLASALASYKAAATSLEAATKADAAANAAMLGAEATYESLNGNIVIAANGSVDTGVITVTGTAAPVLATGVTEVTNPGVTALLAAIKANLATEATLATATATEAKAEILLNRTDVDAAASVQLVAVGQGFATPLAAGTKPTAAQIETETLSLAAKLSTANATLATALGTQAVAVANKAATQAAVDNAGVNVTPEQTAANTAAGTALTAANTAATNAQTAATTAAGKVATFKALVDAFDAADSNPLADAQLGAEEDVADAELAVEVLAAEIADLEEVAALAAQLKSLDAAVKAAGEVFAENDFVAPVTLTSFVAGTDEADIFVAGTVNSTVVNFGSDDLLFIGADYTINKGALSTGNNAVLEAFVAQVGANTVITLETKAFGSASSDAEIVITLTGVNVADVTFANGIISI